MIFRSECHGRKPVGIYGRMPEAERKLEQEIAALLAEAQRVDAAEDAQYGKGTRGDELPAELARRESRLAKMLTAVTTNLGATPGAASAGSGYFSAAAVTDPALAAIDLYVAVARQRHEGAPAAALPDEGTVVGAMRAKIASSAGHAIYAMRKAIVEPVFGQIKEERGFRRFSFRGCGKVQAEWLLICLTHKLLKLFRAGWIPQAA
jgi:hypothetical protein